MTATAASKTLLVIGANRGIGYELATRTLARGYQVYGTYRPQTRDDPTVTQLKKQGIRTFEVDFLDEESINMMAKDFGDKPLDVLINCGGIYHDWDNKGFDEQSAEDLLTHFKVNTVGPFLTSKALLPALKKADVGKIINISSNMAGVAKNYGGNASYRISKTALNQLTKNMAVDLHNAGSAILTLAVHPGWLPTRLTDGHGEDDMDVCMNRLIATFERLGTPQGADLESGSYVKWSGEKLAY